MLSNLNHIKITDVMLKRERWDNIVDIKITEICAIVTVIDAEVILTTDISLET